MTAPIQIHKTPTISGPHEVRVGKALYGLPEGVRVIRKRVGANGSPAAYVLAPDGRVHAFVAAGEVALPSAVEAALASKHFGRIGTPARAVTPKAVPGKARTPEQRAARSQKRTAARLATQKRQRAKY